MIPKSLSATSLHVAELCMARWQVEFLNKGEGLGNVAATTGSTVHLGLERFVRQFVIEKGLKRANWEWEGLKAHYEMAYMELFQSGDFTTQEYTDGLMLTRTWFDRTNLDDVEVLSVENKENFIVPAKLPDGSKLEIPLNFIIDRFDKIGPNSYRVVDYKTIRWAPTNDQLRRKLQAKIYALACRIKFPDAEEIWVQFDCLRHDNPVEVLFTRDDNINTWRQLRRDAQRIVDTPETDVPETLNSECRFCLRRMRCLAMRSNIVSGGVMSVTVDEAVTQLAKVKDQMSALKVTEDELEGIVVGYAKELDLTEWQMENGALVELRSKGRRGIDPQIAAKIIGEEVFAKYGNLTMGVVDMLLKGDEINADQKKQLQALIKKNWSEPTIYVTPAPQSEE